MKKLTSIILSSFALFGVSNASTNEGNKKLDIISNINEDTQLMLESSKDYQDMFKKGNIDLVSAHYSHRSHMSHRSHVSHYSSYR